MPNSRKPSNWKSWLVSSHNLRDAGPDDERRFGGGPADDDSVYKLISAKDILTPFTQGNASLFAKRDDVFETILSEYMREVEDPNVAVVAAKQAFAVLEDRFSIAPEPTEGSSTPRRPNKRTYLLWGSIFKASAEGPSSPKPKVYRPAGHLAVTVLSFALPKKVYEDVFAQAIADLRDEVNELDLEGKVWKRRWITFLGNCTFGLMVGMVVATGIGRKIFDLWKMV